MSAQIIPFRYEDARELRTLLIDGEPWFVASDVAAILGYRMASDMTRAMDDDERGTRPVRTPSGDQDMSVISEGGMWRAIMQRQTGRMDDGARDGVRTFQRWVTHEVIPAIRKTGSYGVAKALPQNYAEALRELAAQVEAHELAKVRIRELEPAASAWTSLVEATGDYSVADAAKMLSRDPAIAIGQNTLFRYMGKHGWLYQRNSEWHPYQDKIDAGLLTLKTNRPYWDSRRGVDVLPAPTVRITAKGVQKLYRLLGGAETTMVEAS
jgi:prophage antirepressor-like protein